MRKNDTPAIPRSASIVVLTGAGISAESGLATFRASDGLWEDHRVEDVATPEAYVRNPTLVHEFYNQRRRGLLDPKIKPNPAHLALAQLEKEWPGDILIVTQNIDNLHERAGSKNIIHMHGEVLKAFCHFCHHKIDCVDDLNTEITCASCARTGGVRPDIVWFGEMPYHMERIFEELENCEMFLSIGTSGNVYPAAGFVHHARMSGAHTMEFNLEPSNVATAFHDHVQGPAGTTLPEFVTQLLSEHS